MAKKRWSKPSKSKQGSARTKSMLPEPRKAKPSLGEAKQARVLAKIAEKPPVVEASEEGTAPHGVVIARAGTGKTFTEVVGVANIFREEVWPALVRQLGFDPKPTDQQKVIWDFMAQERPRSIIYAAFNNAIVREFEEKWKWLCELLKRFGVDFRFQTINSLGNAVVGRHLRFGWNAVNDYNVRNLLELEWQKQEWFRGMTLRDMPFELWKQKSPVIYAVEELVSLCKQTLTYSVGRAGAGPATPNGSGSFEGVTLHVSNEQLEELSFRYGVELNGCQQEVLELVNVLLNKCRYPGDNGVRKFDFDDQIWLPVVNNMEVPKCDLLLVDEGQDLSRCKQQLMLRAGKRILLVGDDRQAIYGFAGADTDSMPRMQQLLVGTDRCCEVMKLTKTRRCGKAIVQEANKLVQDFEAFEENSDGKVGDMQYEDAWEKYQPGDMVLCRTNAPLYRVAFGLLREGRAIRVQGRRLSEGFKQLIRLSKAGTIADLLLWLDDYLRKQTEKLQKRSRTDGSASDALVAVQDKVHCLRLFCEGATEIKDVYDNMEKVFQEKVKGQRPPSVLLSSVHRAKGLEAERVFILRPELMPHPMAKTPEAKAQEENLRYVAITRAIDELVYVQGEPTDLEE